MTQPLAKEESNHTVCTPQHDALFERAGLSEQTFPTATLYVVGLPIGNIADITLRALWTLSICDAIACEDTRETRKLLDRFGIVRNLVSVHEHNEREAAGLLIERLRAGERVALVTDAGTPAVSDPGARAVQSVREAGFGVQVIPGASALVSAMSGAGLQAYRFTFAGFVSPSSKGREKALEELASRGEAFVLYEAPHRLESLLKELAGVLEPDRRLVVARELTKRFESFYSLRASELADWMRTHEPRGEYVILVDETTERNADELDSQTLRWVEALAKEMPTSRAAAVIARLCDVKRDIVYKALLEAAGKTA